MTNIIKISDNLTKKLRTFPVDQELRLYVCGITVYDYCHIGHSRVLLVFDAFVRYLRSNGHKVKYVRNITDIDDKIINKAAAEGVDFQEITGKFIAAMHADEDKLGLLRPDIEPRATEYIAQMLDLIGKLLASGHAYLHADGDVYYDIAKFPDYGKLSRRDLAAQQAGARVAEVVGKRNDGDFVLWKVVKDDSPSWESPWGAGRPGWHIECSAMSTSIFGETLSIHGGGIDLICPHHDNEVAQTEAGCGYQCADIWMHVGHVQMEGTKMSKSLRNTILIKDFLAEHHAEALRLFMLQSHYASPFNFTQQAVSESNQALVRLYGALQLGGELDYTVAPGAVDAEMQGLIDRYSADLADDFNTAKALASLFGMAKHINKLAADGSEMVAAAAQALGHCASWLGLLSDDPHEFLQGSQGLRIGVAEIEKLLSERQDARASGNYGRADEIRGELLAAGIEILDGKDGTTWRAT